MATLDLWGMAHAGTWSNPVRLTHMRGQSWSPEIAAWGDNLYVVWFDTTEDYGDYGDTEIFFIKSPDNGLSWGPPLRLTNDSSNQQYPFVAARDDWVYLIWDDLGSGRVYFAKSNDYGEHFQSYPLTPPCQLSRGTDILVDRAGRVHVLWYDNGEGHTNLYYKRSDDHGETWTSDVCLTCAFGNVDNEQGKIREEADGTLHVIYRSDLKGDPVGGMPPYDFFHLFSTDGGDTWSQPPLPVTPTLPTSYTNEYSGNFVVSGDALLFSCYSELTQNQVIFMRGEAKGCLWHHPPTEISHFSVNYEPSFTEHNYPAMALTPSGQLHIVYMQSLRMIDPSTILYGPFFHVVVKDGGKTVLPPSPVPGVEIGLNPKMVYSGGKLHLVYTDYHEDYSGPEIYYMYYTLEER